MGLIVALLLACLLYFLQQFYFKKHWNRNLQVALHFTTKAVAAGESCYLEEVITNNKRMPLPTLQVKFRTTASFCFAEEKNAVTTDYYYRWDLFSVGGRKRVTRSLKFRAGQRGYFQIQELDVLAKDYFLANQYSIRQSNETALYVYPYKRDTNQFDLLYHRMMGEIVAKKRLEEDPFAFRGIREYIPGDPMHRINWKSSARNHQLLVNVFETTTSQTICILLDGRARSVLDEKRMQEMAISVVSSLAGRLIKAGIPVALYSNARDILTQNPVHTEAGSHRQHMESIDRSLARIDLSVPMNGFAETVKEVIESTGNGMCYLFVTADYSDRLVQEYQRQRKNGIEIFGIVLCEKERHPDLEDGISLWEVDG